MARAPRMGLEDRMGLESTPLSDEDWDDLSGLIRDSVCILDADAARRFGTAALADPDRCGRVLLALIKERGIRREPAFGSAGADVLRLPTGPHSIPEHPAQG